MKKYFNHCAQILFSFIVCNLFLQTMLFAQKANFSDTTKVSNKKELLKKAKEEGYTDEEMEFFIREYESANQPKIQSFQLQSIQSVPLAANPSCTNPDFENGLNGWTGTTGSFSGNNFVEGVVPTRHAIMSDPTVMDGPTYARFSTVAPGGNFSVRLGNSGTGAQSEQLMQKFRVTEGNSVYTYNIAVVLEFPGHVASQNPFFNVKILDDNNNLVPCSEYKIIADATIEGFIAEGNIRYRPWTENVVDLSNYIGQDVTIIFTTADCAAGAHFGYAYIDGSCLQGTINTQNELTVGSSIGFSSSAIGNLSNETYLWEFGDGSTSQNVSPTHVYYTPGIYEVKLTITTPTSIGGCTDRVYTSFVRILGPPICETLIPKSPGSFKIDKATGKIVFDMEDCPVQLSLGCISNNPDPLVLTNVIAASATTFSDTWSYDLLGYSLPVENSYDKGEAGKWRAKSAYGYNEKISNYDKNFNTGTYKMELFSWADPSSNNPDKWLKASTIDLYSPHGEALQDHNLLGIYNTTKLGYDEALPYLTAQNASYKTVFFESFEKTYSASGGGFEDRYKPLSGEAELTEIYAHSGTRSLRLTGTSGLKKLTLASMEYATGGMSIKCWMRFSNAAVYNSLEDVITIKVAGTLPNYKRVIARAGEWVLYEVRFSNLSVTTLYAPVIGFSGPGDIWIDDIRIQPSEAQMMTYVYDPSTFRLLAVFDDQHFGLYYQYNTEGQLVRKLKETERGIKTIQETQYNLPTTTLLGN